MKETILSIQAIRELREAAASGRDWYIAPDLVEEGTFLITVMCNPFGEDTWTAYQVEFTWNGAEHAEFVFDISEFEESLSPASSSPWDGWVAWGGPDVLIAWAFVEDGDLGSAKLEGRCPFAGDGPETDSPAAWAELARIITHQLMQ